ARTRAQLLCLAEVGGRAPVAADVSAFPPMFKNTWIANAYSGGAKLWKVFWIGYVGTLLPVTILANIAKETAVKNPTSLFSFAVFLMVWLLYAWLAILLGRCARNSSHRAFALLGRLWSIILGIFLLSGVRLIFQISRA